jgi:outer membrane protein
MSLQECIIYARENNLNVKKSEVNLGITEEMKTMQFGNFLPNIGANGSYSYNKGFAIDPTNNRIQPAVQSVVMSASASWDVFTGLRNLNNYRRAKFELLASQYNLEQLKDDISLQVADAYLQIILQKEFLKVAETQMQTSEAEVERLSKLVESGARPKGDLFEAQATLANDDQQFVSVENNLLLAKLNLAQLLQIEFSEDFDIADTEFPMPSLQHIARSDKEVFENAINNQYSIKSQSSRILSAERDYQASIGSYMPTLSLVYSFSSRFSFDRFQYAIDPNNSFTVPIGYVQSTNDIVVTQQNGILENDYAAVDQLIDNKNHYIGLNLNIPIFNRLQTRGNARIKKMQLETAKIDLEIQKDQLRQNIERASTDAKAALKTYSASQKALESLTEAYKYAQQKRDVGVFSEYDYNQSRNRLVNAQSTMLRAKYDFIFKVKVLEFYFGDRFGIE